MQTNKTEARYGNCIILPGRDYPQAEIAGVTTRLQSLYLPEAYAVQVRTLQRNQKVEFQASTLWDIANKHSGPLIYVLDTDSQSAKKSLRKMQLNQNPSGLLNDNVFIIGMPTTAEGDTKNPPSNEEIQHYINQLYLFIAQGKNVCLRVRRVNWAENNETATARKHASVRANKYPPTYEKQPDNTYLQKYEYDFGEGRVEFEGQYQYLEDKLNTLSLVAAALQAQNLDLEAVKKLIPAESLPAFEQGLNDKNVIGLNPFIKVAKLTGVDQIWHKVNEESFKRFILNQGHTFDVKDNRDIVITVNDKDRKKQGEILIRKTEDKHIEAEARDLNPSVLELMTKAIYKALGAEGKVRIEITNISPASPQYVELKDQLWLLAMSTGLTVVDYQPTNQQLFERGVELRASFLEENEDSLEKKPKTK